MSIQRLLQSLNSLDDFMNHVSTQLLSDPRVIQALSSAIDLQLQVRANIKQTLAKALSEMDIPTVDDHQTLLHQIDELKLRVTQLEQTVASFTDKT